MDPNNLHNYGAQEHNYWASFGVEMSNSNKHSIHPYLRSKFQRLFLEIEYLLINISLNPYK